MQRFFGILCFLWGVWTLSCVANENEMPSRFNPLIEKFASQYRVNTDFVKAVIWRESRFKPRATGSAGEIGLMQVKMAVVKDWAKAMKKPVPTREEVFDPYLNLNIGIWCLSRALSNWEGNPDQLSLALCEYNAGRKALLTRIVHCDGDCGAALEQTGSAKYAAAVTDKFLELSLSAILRPLLLSSSEGPAAVSVGKSN